MRPDVPFDLARGIDIPVAESGRLVPILLVGGQQPDREARADAALGVGGHADHLAIRRWLQLIALLAVRKLYTQRGAWPLEVERYAGGLVLEWAGRRQRQRRLPSALFYTSAKDVARVRILLREEQARGCRPGDAPARVQPHEQAPQIVIVLIDDGVSHFARQRSAPAREAIRDRELLFVVVRNRNRVGGAI